MEKITYYSNGQMKCRYNKDEYELKQGLYESWYPNGQLREQINYKDGEKDGLYEWWFENGVLGFRGNYKEDELDGICEWWCENGKQMARINYKDGNRLKITIWIK